MNEFALLERYRFLIVVLLVIVCQIILTLIAQHPTNSYDAFWHLRMGQDLIENGLSPRLDHYSFTFKGEPILSNPYIFQVFLYYLVNTFGLEGGFVLYKIIAFTALLTTASIWLWQIRAPVLIIAVYLAILLSLSQARVIVRPDLISNSLVMVALILMYRANNEYSVRTMLPVVLLMVFWVNYHTPILGYIVLFGFFVDSIAVYYRNQVDKETWVSWLFWGGIIAATGFVNPDLSHAVFSSLNFDPRWKNLIQEYIPSIYYAKQPVVYILLAVASLLIALLVRQKRIGLLIVVIILSYNALLLARMVVVSGIIFISLLAMLLSEMNFSAWIGRQSPKFRHSISIILISVLGILVFHTLHVIQTYDRFRNPYKAIYPYKIVEYIKTNNLAGRILNEYSIGGFLLYHLAPHSEIYIDGRTNTLYPIEHLIHYHKVLSEPELFHQEVIKYDIGHAILATNPLTFDVVHSAADLTLNYVGINYSLFSAEGGEFETLQLLAARPACWSSLLYSELNEELALAERTFPKKSSFMLLLRLVEKYRKADDPTTIINSLTIANRFPDWSLRFVGYQSLELGLFEKAFSFFDAVADKNPRDFMAGSWALLQSNKPYEAESFLYPATSVKWINLQLPDLVAMQNLLNQIAESGGLKIIPDSFLENLKSQVAEYEISDKDKNLHIGLFCGNIATDY